MKRSWEIRLAIIVASCVALAGALSGVLYAEERKRIESRDGQVGILLDWLRSSDAVRRRYYENLSIERDRLRRQMDEARAAYDELLGKQSALVTSGQKQVTEVVTEQVPVQVEKTIPVKSSRSSKSS